jgi:hypothetical protein
VADTGLASATWHTGEERWLAYPVQRDDMESRASRDAYPGMAFTPDSRRSSPPTGGSSGASRWTGASPSEIPFTARVELPMGPEVDFLYPIEDTPTFTVKQIRDATPSPDGSRLAFSALGRIYVQEGTEGTPRRSRSSPGTSTPPPGPPTAATWSS